MADGPDLLERVRMCLAEIGKEPQSVWTGPEGLIYWMDWELDPSIAWRAVTLARMADGAKAGCRMCCIAARRGSADGAVAARERCEAALPLTEDCGIDRRPSSTGDSGR